MILKSLNIILISLKNLIVIDYQIVNTIIKIIKKLLSILKTIIIFFLLLKIGYSLEIDIKETIPESNKIVAFVNKKIITQHELDLKLLAVEYNLKKQKVSKPNLKKLTTQVLNEMIMRQILLDTADKSGIKITTSETALALNKILKDKNITLDQFKNELKEQNSNFKSFYKELEEEIIIEKLTEREVSQKILISKDEVMRVYNTKVYQNKEDFHLASININIPENSSLLVVKQKEKLINNIYERLKNKEDFNKLSIEYSEGSNALSAGDIGWKTSLSMPPALFQQLKNMKIGDFTKVIKIADEFYIFKLLEVRKHNMPDIEKQYHIRHILIKVSEHVSEKTALNKINKLRANIIKNKDQNSINKAFIKNATAYSQDTSSFNQGDIGWISDGDTVANFENAFKGLQIGEISQPVRTVFGWHLIQVLEIRDNDVRKDKEMADIKQELYQAKFQQNYQNWLELLKNSSYIKYETNI